MFFSQVESQLLIVRISDSLIIDALINIQNIHFLEDSYVSIYKYRPNTQEVNTEKVAKSKNSVVEE